MTTETTLTPVRRAHRRTGRPVAIDLAGQRFGAWNVIERAGRTSNGRATWLCRCGCGREVVVIGASLREGRSTRCRSCVARTIVPGEPDEVAVRLACYGDRVRLRIPDKGAAVRRLSDANVVAGEIARLLRMSRRQVIRYQQGQVQRGRPPVAA